MQEPQRDKISGNDILPWNLLCSHKWDQSRRKSEDGRWNFSDPCKMRMSVPRDRIKKYTAPKAEPKPTFFLEKIARAQEEGVPNPHMEFHRAGQSSRFSWARMKNLHIVHQCKIIEQGQLRNTIPKHRVLSLNHLGSIFRGNGGTCEQADRKQYNRTQDRNRNPLFDPKPKPTQGLYKKRQSCKPKAPRST